MDRPATAHAYMIRRGVISDLDDVLEIEKASFADPYDRRIFAHYLSKTPEGFLVIEKEGRIVGYVISAYEGGEGLIVSIAVSPGHERRGIGTMLLRAALDRLARSVKRVQLQVSVKNTGAIEFYHKFSFHVIGIIKRYYPSGDDALVMLKEF